jgi:hypothetical protein
MKTCLIIISAFLVFSSISVCAELPEYSVKKVSQKIVIDGILDESDWDHAESVGDFIFPWWEEGEKEQTEVKLLWDDTFLYISYKVDDKYIWADHYDTNATTYMDDCVELFWNPDPENQEKYNMFEINAIGNLLSVYTGSGVSIHERISRIMVPHVAQTVQGTVNNDDDIDTGWILEVAVRFSDYPELSVKSAPEPGDMWRIGLNRLGGKTNPQHSQWSSEQGEKPSFHTPKFFGNIFFNNEKVQ